MKLIFWGLLFLFININLGRVCITPDFVGYILICFGMAQTAESKTYAQSRPWAVAGMVLGIVLWVIRLLGGYGVVVLLLDLVAVVLELVITYRIAVGVDDLERVYSWNLGSAQLKLGWKIVLICTVVNTVLALLGLGTLSLAVAIVGFVAIIYYVVRFGISWRTYNRRPWMAGGGV